MSVERRYALLKQTKLVSAVYTQSAVLTGTDSGKTFSNLNAPGLVVFTLPKAIPNRGPYTFIFATSSGRMQIICSGTDTLRSGATNFVFNSNQLGAIFEVICVVAGIWDVTVSGGIAQTGSFTGTLTGFSGTAPSGICFYNVASNIAQIYVPVMTGTSNATTMTMTGAGAVSALQPARQQNLPLPILNSLEDNGASVAQPGVRIQPSGTLQFYTSGNTSGFNNSGTKGINANFTITYSLV